MFHKEHAEEFLRGSRILHIYGKIRENTATATQIDWALQNRDLKQLSEFDMDSHHKKMKEFLDVVFKASKGLRVIDPYDKGADDTEILMARRALFEAKRVFILGYRFDEHNSERLNLCEYLADSDGLPYKSVAFTNYQDVGQVNKRASKVFCGNPATFLRSGHLVFHRYEKSVRSTYDALAWDFDLAD